MLSVFCQRDLRRKLETSYWRAPWQTKRNLWGILLIYKHLKHISSGVKKRPQWMRKPGLSKAVRKIIIPKLCYFTPSVIFYTQRSFVFWQYCRKIYALFRCKISSKCTDVQNRQIRCTSWKTLSKCSKDKQERLMLIIPLPNTIILIHWWIHLHPHPQS